MRSEAFKMGIMIIRRKIVFYLSVSVAANLRWGLQQTEPIIFLKNGKDVDEFVNFHSD
jgi:hypothetical protein